MCAITQELMLDPVLCEDGNTYERTAITEWLSTHNTSPLDPSCKLDVSRLMPNRAVKTQIEELVASGELDGDLCEGFKQRQFESSPEYAQTLYDDGQVEKAAELGLPEAMGFMAERCYFGTGGSAKNIGQSVKWAKRAAEAGDKLGQFRLGHAYYEGEGGLPKDWACAALCHEKAANQGHVLAMLFVGDLRKRGGKGLTKNHELSAGWYQKAAEAGDKIGMYHYGLALFKGQGAPKNLPGAREWFTKAADHNDVDAMRRLGTMMIKGEGGALNIGEGFALWEEAAGLGDEKAQENIQEHQRLMATGNFK